MKKIEISTPGIFVFVDDEKESLIAAHSWRYYKSLNRGKNRPRIQAFIEGKRVNLKEAIFGPCPKGKCRIHKNGNILDLTSENIELVDMGLAIASSKRRSKPASGYKGVYKYKNGHLFYASFEHKKIGAFENPMDAAAAYDDAARAKYGELAQTNFSPNR